MFVHSIRLANKAIFPIFAWQQSNNQVGVGVSGTGFFINKDGYFVTAAHVFDAKSKDLTFKYWGKLPEEVINPAIEIEEVARDDANDIFIGKVSGLTPTRYLRLAKWNTKVGQPVCISGYPLAQISYAPATGFQLGAVRRYFQPSFVLDHAKVNSDSNGKIRLHDGFFVRDVGLFGMSGGPIFDEKGFAMGMQGSVSTRESTNGSQNIVVHNAAAVRSNLIIALLSQHNIPYSK